MDLIRPLDAGLLQRLDARLRDVDAEPLRGAEPGLPVEQIRRLTAHLPGSLPAEATLWWSWRRWGKGDVLPGLQAASLEDALAHRQWRCEEARTLASLGAPGVRPDDWWQPSWLPVLGVDGGMLLVIDWSEAHGQCAPIRMVDWQAFGESSFARYVAPSLGLLVEERIKAIDAGEYAYDASIGMWRRT